MPWTAGACRSLGLWRMRSPSTSVEADDTAPGPALPMRHSVPHASGAAALAMVNLGVAPDPLPKLCRAEAYGRPSSRRCAGSSATHPDHYEPGAHGGDAACSGGWCWSPKRARTTPLVYLDVAISAPGRDLDSDPYPIRTPRDCGGRALCSRRPTCDSATCSTEAPYELPCR